eukprot:COSAG06_NODE_11429_length_1512_cov_1.083510_2_plen_153_part_00
MPSPRTPIRLSPTSPQRQPRSRSSSPTRRVVRLSPTGGGPPTTAAVHDAVPNGRMYNDGGGGSTGLSLSRPGGASPRRLRLSNSPDSGLVANVPLHDGGGGSSPPPQLAGAAPGARVVGREHCEREVSRAIVITTELYDVRHPPLYYYFAGN